MSKLLQYESFVTVVNTGAVRLAAETLNRTPSAVSKQISNLENDLGVMLFERNNRKMKLTSQGRLFYQTSVDILKLISESESRVQRVDSAIAGDIKISLSRSLIDSNIMGLIKNFAHSHEHIRFHLQFSELPESFNDSDIDFAFRLGVVSNSARIISRPLGEVSPVLFATPNYLQRFGEPREVIDLKGHSIFLPPTCDLSKDVQIWFNRLDLDSINVIVHRVDDCNAAKRLVLRDAGIGFHLKSSIDEHISSGEARLVLPDILPPKKPLSLVYRKNQHTLTHIEAFKHFVIENHD